MTEYLEFHPTFKQDVLEPITSGNPFLVEQGLLSLSDTYLAMLEEKNDVEVAAVGAEAAGCGAGAKVCFTVYGVFLANVAVYANAGLATMAVVALAVIPASVTYLMDEDQSDSRLVKTELIAELTRALAR